MNLIVSKNQLMQQVAKDFSEVRSEIKKLNGVENDEFPDLSKSITDELNKITSKRTDNVIENIEERFDMMDENLKKIKALF